MMQHGHTPVELHHMQCNIMLTVQACKTEGATLGAGEQAGAVEVEEDLNAEDDEAEVEDALAQAAEAPPAAGDAAPDVKVEWRGASTRQAAGQTFYKYGSTISYNDQLIPHLISHATLDSCAGVWDHGILLLTHGFPHCCACHNA